MHSKCAKQWEIENANNMLIIKEFTLSDLLLGLGK